MILSQGMYDCRMRSMLMSDPKANICWKESDSSSWSYLRALKL